MTETVDYGTLGQEQYEKGKFEEAIESCLLAIEKDPTDKMAFFCLGAAYYKIGDHAKALQCYELFDDGEKKKK